MRLLGPLLLLVVAGCGARTAQPSTPAHDPLRGQTFLSSEITEKGRPHQLAADTRLSLAFTDDHRLVAHAGCNTMSGPVRTDHGRLDVGDGLGMTDMGCARTLLEQDQWLAHVLGTKPEWRLDGPKLTLRTADTELVLTDREVAEPDLPLVDTVWAVDTVLDGQTASSVPAATKATLVFHDTTVAIRGGCNRGSAQYTMTGHTISFGDPVMTRMACAPDKMSLETPVLDVVHGKVTFDIDADRLTMNNPSGKGLQLRAD
jgi:heat shock protein HslJ